MPSHRRQVYGSQPKDVVRATGCQCSFPSGKEERQSSVTIWGPFWRWGLRSGVYKGNHARIQYTWGGLLVWALKHKHPSLHWAEGGAITSKAHLLSSPASTSLCGSFSCPADLSYIPELLIRISIATLYSHLGLPLAEHTALTESTMWLPAAFQSNNNHKLQQIPEVQK